jgi:gamma-glutamyl-gamma-aminobutyrate hydrolase PuuD
VASSASEPAQAGDVPGAGHRPLIGLTTYRERAQALVWDTEFALLHNVYVDSVARAGGIAVLLPPQEHGAGEVTARLDGLVLTGGSDVSPERYRRPAHPQTGTARPWRDDWELRLLGQALDRGLPVLGVCRGAQLLNVALGGTLDQHVPDTVGHQRHCPVPGVFGQVEVTLRPGSTVAGVLGPRATVACHHHQAIGSLAPGLEVAGRADDGVIEAVELRGRPFALGVQWHPEQDGGDLRLFAALVAAATAWTSAGRPGGQASGGQQLEHNQGASRVGS